MISILLHLYYPDSIKTVLPHISPELLEGNTLYVNLVNSAPFDETVFDSYKNVVLVKSSNIGKDIGGKLILIDSLIQRGDMSKYWIFLHDKHSPHTTTGKFWRDNLFSIADIRNKTAILKKFEDKEINVITHKNYINNEWDNERKKFNTVNNEILINLLQKYNINPLSYNFAAGTMFWTRSTPIKSFFQKNCPLKIRATLEKGNVLDHHHGTNAHSWERLLSWIAIDNDKKISGIG